MHLEVAAPGTGRAIRVHEPNGDAINIVVLSREQAQRLWKFSLGGRERLVLSAAQLYADGDRLVLLSDNVSQLRAGFFPAPHDPVTSVGDGGQEGIFRVFEVHIQPLNAAARAEKLSDAGADPPFQMGKEVVLMPSEPAFASAASWRIQAPDIRSDTVSDVLLKIRYQGDIARIYVAGKLLTDGFYYGQPWIVGLRRIPAELLKKGLELRILLLQAQAPIYLPSNARPVNLTSAQVADLAEVELLAVYRAVIETTHWSAY